jgi:uncharacterized membrane protein YgcG
MALRLLSTSARCRHFLLQLKPLRNPSDVRQVSTAAQQVIQGFKKVWMNSRPPKGFEKFFKDKTAGSKETPKEAPKETPKETPKSSSTSSAGGGGKSSSSKKSQQKPDLSQMFKFGSSSGGGGGKSSTGGMDPDMQKYLTIGALGVTAIAAYFTATQVYRITHKSCQCYVTS